jgi:hypothetical protein
MCSQESLAEIRPAETWNIATRQDATNATNAHFKLYETNTNSKKTHNLAIAALPNAFLGKTNGAYLYILHLRVYESTTLGKHSSPEYTTTRRDKRAFLRFIIPNRDLISQSQQNNETKKKTFQSDDNRANTEYRIRDIQM